MKIEIECPFFGGICPENCTLLQIAIKSLIRNRLPVSVENITEIMNAFRKYPEARINCHKEIVATTRLN